MTEVVVAVYTTAHAAEAATTDLEVARVPTTTIRQFVSDPAADEELLEVRHRRMTSGDRVHRRMTSGDRVVTVTVDERHASAVLEILAMQSPAIMTEAPMKVA